MASVVAQVPFNPYTGNGVATVYAYEFQLLAASDLVVTLNGVVTLDFVLSGVGVQAGGAVTFTVAPASGVAVLLNRVISLNRDTDYQYSGDLLEATLDRDFNRLWMATQGVSSAVGGAVRAPYPEQMSVLPAVTGRANKLLSWDSLGNPIAVAAVAGTATQLSIDLATSAGSSLIGFLRSGVGAVLRTIQSKLRESRISVMEFGAVGDGVADDTTAIQNAINQAMLSSNPGTFGSNSPALGPPVVFFPSGYYKVTASLNVTNHVAFEGDGQSEYSSGSRIFMATLATDLFNCTPPASGGSITFEKLTLRALASSTGNLIRLRKNGTASWNSQRYIDLCFGQPQNVAVQIDSGDDIAFQNCLWDVGLTGATQAGVVLGTSTAGEVASNVRFVNCNWFDQQLACVRVNRVDGLSFSGCTAYTDASTRTQFFLNATSALQADNIVIGPMKWSYGRCLASLNNANNFTLNGLAGTLVGIGAGETLSAVRFFGTCDLINITGNNIAGNYDAKSYIDDSGSVAVTRVNWQANTFKNNGGTGAAVVCSKSTGKIRNNNYTGFSQASVGGAYTTTGSAWNPGNQGTLLTGGAAFTCTGAIVGDRLEIWAVGAWPVSTLLVLLPQVNTINQATIAYGNPTAGTINIAAHDWQFEVQR